MLSYAPVVWMFHNLELCFINMKEPSELYIKIIIQRLTNFLQKAVPLKFMTVIYMKLK